MSQFLKQSGKRLVKYCELEKEKRSKDAIGELVNVWEDSVKATHSFLKLSDIESIKQYVPQALKEVPHLVVAIDDDDQFEGFIGIDGQKIEMLFVSSSCRGHGIGRTLLCEAIDRYQVKEVVVNEENTSARGFYEHMGFQVYARSETDEQGGPFPILFMKKL